ncbi:hypothetical protein EsDP_00001661 [Epichloe bromicola]|uniref:Uncharacterized protein n=1 Tax=Epichloe bromicola TaxID=79588 RepID=A0ABQ0CIH8_9HYPO
MIEDGESQMSAEQRLGVCDGLGDIDREIHSLWHARLLDEDKKPGWGRELDDKSDSLLKRAGELLGGAGSITDEVYRFAIAYGRLRMVLPCIT